MRRIIVLTAVVMAFSAASSYAYNYNVSNKSLNTMVCPAGEQITDVFVSEKAQLKVDTRKDRLFFEFSATRYDADGYITMQYATDPTTVVLFCGDDEYSVTLKPKTIEGVAIELPAKENKVMKAELDGLRREEQISKLIQLILTDKTAGFKTVAGDQAVKLGDKEIYLRKIHTAGGYRIKELYIHADQPSEISEEELLSVSFIGFPVAMTLPENGFTGWQRIISIEEVVR